MTISGIGKVLAQLDGMADKMGNGGYVDVGFLEGQMHSSKSGNEVPMVLVAAANEFGNPAQNRPPRPFMRNTFDRESDTWAKQLSLAIARGETVKDALEYLGTLARDDMMQTIRDFQDPPLAPSTIAAKGNSKPLVDTGEMLETGVQYKVHT